MFGIWRAAARERDVVAGTDFEGLGFHFQLLQPGPDILDSVIGATSAPLLFPHFPVDFLKRSQECCRRQRTGSHDMARRVLGRGLQRLVSQPEFMTIFCNRLRQAETD